MDIFKTEQFEQLLLTRGLHHVTIYSPTSRESTDGYRKDKINFKNQLREAESRLGALYHLSEQDAKAYLRPGYDLLDSTEFWQHGSDGVAYFQNSAGVHIYTLPIAIDQPQTQVGRHFMLRPLIPLLNANGRFYILNLNLNQITLFEATEATISEIIVPAEATDQLVEYTQYIERQEHTGSRNAQGGSGGSVHYGQGGADDAQKEIIQQFFYQASKVFDNFLNCDPLPVVLTGVDYLIPMYTTASDYTHYIPESVAGSFTRDDAATLHAKAWQIISPTFEQQRHEQKERFAELSQGDWASTDTKKVVKAALTGQVDTLFVQEDATLWGVFNAQSYELELASSATPENTDLLTEAAVKTISQKGKVFTCTPEEMPDGAAVIAAIFRNPVVV